MGIDERIGFFFCCNHNEWDGYGPMPWSGATIVDICDYHGDFVGSTLSLQTWKV